MPQAELHVHLEGTAPPALIRRLADRNGIQVPEGVFAAPDRFAWVDFLDFLRTYDLAATRDPHRAGLPRRHLRVPDAPAPREGAVYVELIASPDHAASVGLTDAEHYGGIAQGIDDARARPRASRRGSSSSAIRNFGVEAARGDRPPHGRGPPPVRRRLQPGGRRGRLPAGAVRPARTRSPRPPGSAAPSTPASTPAPSRCARRSPCRSPHVARRARDRGSGAGGGDRRARDRARGLPHVQRRHRVYAGYETHPLRALFEAGVKLTLGSDDPPYFGASIGGEYAVARERLGFEEGELRAITRTADRGVLRGRCGQERPAQSNDC